jgi:hypothetical protein
MVVAAIVAIVAVAIVRLFLSLLDLSIWMAL